MKTITVDDEQIAVNSLLRILRTVDPDGQHDGVIRADDFLSYINSNHVDIAFVDVDLHEANGIALTRKLAKTHPKLNIVLYTGHPEFKPEAMDLFVSGYLVKPATKAALEEVLAHLRFPVRDVRVQCFGFFEVFVGGKPMKFGRKDSKEVFAYLVDRRGVAVSDDTIRYLLWSEEDDNEKKRTYVRNIIYDIRNAFSAAGIDDIIISQQGFYSLNTEKIRCDYYDWLNGKNVPAAKLREYMEQFSSWSVMTKNAIFAD